MFTDCPSMPASESTGSRIETALKRSLILIGVSTPYERVARTTKGDRVNDPLNGVIAARGTA